MKLHARTLVLGAACAAAAVMAARSWLLPLPNDPVPAIALPATVPLSAWDFVGTEPWDPDTDRAQLYRYRRDGVELSVRARFVPYSEGNVSRLRQVYLSIPPATASLRERTADSGTYGFYTHDGNAAIAGCVNPHGNTTLTEQQFAQNLSTHGWQLQRVLPWLAGQQDLIDRSCLLSVLSVPAIAEDSDRYPHLHSAWLDWASWWQQNYPQVELRSQPPAN